MVQDGVAELVVVDARMDVVDVAIINAPFYCQWRDGRRDWIGKLPVPKCFRLKIYLMMANDVLFMLLPSSYVSRLLLPFHVTSYCASSSLPAMLCIRKAIPASDPTNHISATPQTRKTVTISSYQQLSQHALAAQGGPEFQP